MYASVTRRYTTCGYCLMVLGPGEKRWTSEHFTVHFCSKECHNTALVNGIRLERADGASDTLAWIRLVDQQSIYCRRIAGQLPVASCDDAQQYENCWCDAADDRCYQQVLLDDRIKVLEKISCSPTR